MHYLDEVVYPPVRLAIPPSLRKEGEELQEILGQESVFLASNEEIFRDALASDLANAWVADGFFLENLDLDTSFFSHPLVLVRTAFFETTSTMLNRWRPSAFVDFPLEKEEVETALLALEKALHVKEDLTLFTALRSTLKRGQTRQVVLDMERAFDKEVSIIRNDFYYQQLCLPARPNVMLRLDMVYKPMELLSGDSYSVRRIGKDRVVCFLIDAMSKGVAAALTSTSSTSMLNYLIDTLQDNFTLQTLVYKYLGYITKELMEDEILSVFFLVFDKRALMLEFASFGMPPFLATTPKGGCEVIRANNMPISPYTEGFTTNTLSIAGFNRFLAYSDGLNESETTEGELYKKELPRDFLHSVNITDFMEKVGRRIGGGSDDIAYFYLQGIDTTRGEKKSFALLSTREGIEKGLYQVKPFLEHQGADAKSIAQSTLALSELLTNALEHGSFGVDKKQKQRFIQEGIFEEMLEKWEQTSLANRTIWLRLRVYRQGRWKMFEATVEDEGAGFDTREVKNGVVRPASVNGRGFLIVKKLVDRFYFNTKGNAITILKRLA